jgi:hypothetical protein
MKTKSTCFLALIFIFCACHDNKETAGSYKGPRVVEAKGYVVSKDSMELPVVIPVDENKLRKITAGKPTVVSINTNIHAAGAPKVIPAGVPRVNTPGTGMFALPKTVPAIDRPFIAGNPE